MLRAINLTTTHRPPTIITHRARLTAETSREDDPTMESYRNQIIMMLDSVTDAKLMRLIHDVLKTILSNR